MRLAILGAKTGWYAADLARAAGRRHEISAADYRRLWSEVGDHGCRVMSELGPLDAFDAVLLRSMPPGSLEQVVLRMDFLARLESAGVVVINPPKAIEAAVDKYLTTARLAGAGLPVPRTMVCQTAGEALAAFDALGGDVVIKPLFGSEGRGITRISDRELAGRAFVLLEQMASAIYLQSFVPHEGCDLRLLVVGREVLAVRRRHPHDWRTNVSRGATAEPCPASAAAVELARAAAKAVGAPLAGVDLLPARDGKLYVLEVNAVPGWKALAAALGVDVAARVLELVEEVVSGQARA